MERQGSMAGPDTKTIDGRKNDRLLILKSFLFSPLIYLLFRMALSAIFLWSGMAKLTAPGEFAAIIESYGLLPDRWIMPAAIALPMLEVVAGLGLMAHIQGSLALITGLLGLFMVILSYGIWMGFDVDCGCFGPEDSEAKAFHGLRSALVRDIIMMMGICYLYWWRYRSKIVPKRITRFWKKTYEGRR